MKINDYFEKKKGLGILSTADHAGEVSSAIYARPHIEDDHNLAFVMSGKKAYSNVKNNPRASYLFLEEGNGYSGVRLSLTKTHEEKSPHLIRRLLRRRWAREELGENRKELHLVFFHIDKVLPLTASGRCPVTL